MKICVYGAASSLIDKSYIEAGKELGRKIVERGHGLVFGGGSHGMMGAVVDGVFEKSGYSLGIIPEFFREAGAEISSKNCTDYIYTETMRERKRELEENSNAFIPNQFNNFANPNAHYNTTALEILQDVGEKIDGLCLGIGSGGSISGIGRRLKEANPKIVIWAVEPEKAAILSGGKVETHIQMGIGDGIVPSVLDKKIIDKVIKVSDAAAVHYAKLLAKNEGIACGISSGSNMFGSLLLAKELGIGKRVVTIFPDGAERYFSTPLFL